MQKKNIVFMLSIVSVAATASLLTKNLLSQPSSVPNLTVKILHKFHRYPSGELVRTDETITARRSDGSTVECRWVKSPTGAIMEQRNVTDLAAGRIVVLDGLTDSMTTYPLTANQVAERRKIGTRCDGEPAGEILGYAVVRVDKELPGQRDELQKLESWLAPQLNCTPLKEVYYVGPAAGPVQVVNIREVIEVTLATPASSLFVIPSGYSERSPSEVVQEFDRRYQASVAAPVCATCRQMSASDEAYQKHRENR